MSPKSQNSNSTFYEVVFQGKPKVVRAFVSGLVMGACDGATVYYSFLDGIHHEGKTERLAEMVGIRSTECYVVVDDCLSAVLKKLGRRIKEETGLSIRSHRKIRGAGFDFEYNAYAKKYDDEILEVIRHLPPDVKARGFKHQVHKDPSAKGVEAYTAAHDYEAAGKGAITGPIDQVIEVKRRFGDLPLIKTEDIVLKLA